MLFVTFAIIKVYTIAETITTNNMETTNTKELQEILDLIPIEIQSMYLINIHTIGTTSSIVIKHPFWIFLTKDQIERIDNNATDLTIKCKHMLIMLWKSKVDAQIIILD